MSGEMMRFSISVFLAGLLAAGAASAPAYAEVQTGNEISVNPVPANSGTLLYPGGQYMRVVRPLLQPGEKPGPLQLHLPRQRAARTAAVRHADAAAPEVRAAVAAPAPPAPKPAPARRVAAAPAHNPDYDASAGQLGAAGLDLGAAPSQMAKPPPPQQMAKAAPPGSAAVSAGAVMPGLTKRSVILFAAGAPEPAQSALGAIKFLAGDLNASMTGAGSRIQILAYGGDKGDKGSEARRLSLKRALAIRQVLIDDGVASERIDVRAMGGADDGGPADRVDVYIKT
jgi:outer membrane protein OmpA-like peptidoglycan-associated protein